MPVAVDIPLAEMASASVLYQTQRLTLYQPGVGGKQVKYGTDPGVRPRGRPFFHGMNSIVQGDRSSFVSSAFVEALLVRMSTPGTKFANPVLREDSPRLWAFRGVRSGDTVGIDPSLCNGFVTASADGTQSGTGQYTVDVTVSLATADPTLSNLEVAVRPGALFSAGGKLFMVTTFNDWGTTISGIEPRRGLIELAMNARLEWRAPWVAARFSPNEAANLMRDGNSSGPWSYEWQEADQ